jgi:starch synthase
MRILLASSEVHPYSKTGGLADMVGALGKTLARKGHEVGIVTPLYAGVRKRFPALNPLRLSLDLPLGNGRATAQVYCLRPAERLTIYFVDQAGFFERPGLYQENGRDYPDNAERFIFFSKAVARLALALPSKLDILHLHDWQPGLAALLLREELKREGKGTAGQGTGPRICLTIHNLAYQGIFPADRFPLTNLPWDFFKPDGVEFYNQLNSLKAAIVYSDVITTVSPRYAREIMTEEMGCGLDGLLRKRQNALFGILNGVDYEEWNPMSDLALSCPFSVDDLSGKAANKLALQEEFKLSPRPDIPLFGNVGRLAEQKGVDILLRALEETSELDFQFVLLGSGETRFEQAYEDLARRFPGRIAVKIGFDEALSHRIEAGSDFFLMPSRFEPCGLNQMYGLRYGAIPIVRTTGGLDDTVIDIKEDAEHANGIKFIEYSSAALAKGIRKALALYGEPPLLAHYRKNAMTADFSWERTTDDYLKVYTGEPKE